MKKIKIFRFEVSNWSSEAFEDDLRKPAYLNSQKTIVTEEQMEAIINDFIKDKVVVSISTDTIRVQNHNNGRGNTVHLVYSILYS